jgi:hypothetical protein
MPCDDQNNHQQVGPSTNFIDLAPVTHLDLSYCKCIYDAAIIVTPLETANFELETLCVISYHLKQQFNIA